MNDTVLVLVEQSECSFTVRLVSLVICDVNDDHVVNLSQILRIQFLAAHIPDRNVDEVSLGRMGDPADKFRLTV